MFRLIAKIVAPFNHKKQVGYVVADNRGNIKMCNFQEVQKLFAQVHLPVPEKIAGIADECVPVFDSNGVALTSIAVILGEIEILGKHGYKIMLPNGSVRALTDEVIIRELVNVKGITLSNAKIVNNKIVPKIGHFPILSYQGNRPTDNNYNNELNIEKVDGKLVCTGFKDTSHITLKNLVITGDIDVIAESAFENCTSLQSVKIESGVKEIEDKAFNGCSNLKDLYIPDSVSSIGNSVFDKCVSLYIVRVPEFWFNYADGTNFDYANYFSFYDIERLFRRTPWYSKHYNETRHEIYFDGRLVKMSNSIDMAYGHVKAGTVVITKNAFAFPNDKDGDGLIKLVVPTGVNFIQTNIIGNHHIKVIADRMTIATLIANGSGGSINNYLLTENGNPKHSLVYIKKVEQKGGKHIVSFEFPNNMKSACDIVMFMQEIICTGYRIGNGDILDYSQLIYKNTFGNVVKVNVPELKEYFVNKYTKAYGKYAKRSKPIDI